MATYRIAQVKKAVKGTGGLFTVSLLTEHSERQKIERGRKPNSLRPLPNSIGFYSLFLCLEKRYEKAMDIANWGWDHAVEWGRASSYIGGLLCVLGESLYRTGHIEESKDYYLKSYYAYLIMRNTADANIICENIQEYYSIDV